MSIFKKRPFLSSDHTRLYWAILLLVAAVVLPTVSLLWFVSQAFRNERLAIRQKLIDVYSGKTEELFGRSFSESLAEGRKILLDSASAPAAKFSASLPNNGDFLYVSAVIYDQHGRVAYPVLSFDETIGNASFLEKAGQLEFVEKDLLKAADSYGRIADSGDEELWAVSLTGRVRCLKKANKIKEAIEACSALAWPARKSNSHVATPSQRGEHDRLIADARLMQLTLYQAVAHPDFYNACQKVLANQFADLTIDSPTMVFLLQQCIDIAEKGGFAAKLADKIINAKKIIAADQASINAAQLFPTTASMSGWPEETFRLLADSGKIYGIHFTSADRHILGLVSGQKMAAFWTKAGETINNDMVFSVVLDNTGRVVCSPTEESAGKNPVGELFFTYNLGQSFPGWKFELFFKGNVFTAAARRQQLVYLWTLILVIGAMLVASGLVMHLILKQARLNKLKNDFIATVTHELKTPLSSMRLLVDTLLDGRVADTKQAEEYLSLVSKENERLSRLIDNFLTFSRMERNKKAFDFSRVSPADIANAAVEAFGPKINRPNCKFILSVDENLPLVSADKDAMVTVLINLLDNAYKYSYDDKQIEMKVFTENGQVCFLVKDNGIGMSRRVVKKIFDKFYQADTSLSRRAGGCGLGLSIVKFIVDAHKGRIIVNSEPGKGSEFTVTLPLTI